jgi:hypothetical protein
LHYAVRGGEDGKFLLFYRTTLVVYCFDFSCIDCVQLLLDHGADVTAKGAIGTVIETAEAEQQVCITNR